MSFCTIEGIEPGPAPPDTIVVDSGNTTLIMPDFGALAALPNFANDFQVLVANTVEPWGCPASIVRGPIEILTADGVLYTIPNCVFFACKGANAQGQRTGNFGIGCVSPWPVANGIRIQSPLSYNPSYPMAAINFAPAQILLANQPAPAVNGASTLTLYPAVPGGFSMFNIIANLDWMALVPKSLTIGAVKTLWPSNNPPPIAMIDCGGGPVYLSDPNGYLYKQVWPEQAQLPGWANNGSVACQAIKDDIQIELGDAAASLSLTIAEGALPPSVQSLTMVICQSC
jgi:hypothetical protein